VVVPPAPVTVARYSFDRGVAAGQFAEESGRSAPLRVRSANGGVVRFTAHGAGQAVGFPAACVPTAATCPRVVLEAVDDVDLNPATRAFRYGVTVAVGRTQLSKSANVMQKGVAGTGSQWKLLLGAGQGKAQCVVTGQGATTAYVAKSDVSVADGNWHQLSCVRSATALAIVVDGRQRSQVTLPATLTISNNLPLRVGAANFSTRTDRFNGYLDDAFVALG
jgi:hypothetical protein